MLVIHLRAIEVARRLVETVRRQTGVNVSVGLSVAGEGEPLTQAFARADEAVYAAKAGGRDGAMLVRGAAPGAATLTGGA